MFSHSLALDDRNGMRETYQHAWRSAIDLHRDLAAGGGLGFITAPPSELPTAAGDGAVGQLVGLRFERFMGSDVYYRTGGGFVVGSPQFVTGYLLGSIVQNAQIRRKAKALAAPRWRESKLGRTVVTTQRIWCEVITAEGSRWLHFSYDTISAAKLADWSLTLNFHSSEPLRLSGAWAPWIAVVVAYWTYGRSHAHQFPGLTNLIGAR